MNFIFLMLEFLTSSAFPQHRITAPAAFPSLKVSFIDACNRTQVDFSSLNGTKLKMIFEHLNTNVPLEVDITWSHAGLAADIAKKHQVVDEHFYPKKTFKKAFSLELFLPENALDEVEDLIPGSHFWTANVNLSQEGRVESQSAVIYRTDGAETYFKVISPLQCSWESGPATSSTFYYNADQPVLTISREIWLQDHSAFQRGRHRGPDMENPAGNIDLTAPGNGLPTIPIAAYYVSENSEESALQQIITIRREWTLTRGQGAIFADRFSFNRMLAQKIEWRKKKKDKCGRYLKTGQGLLDVGIRTSDLYSIPLSYSGDSKKTTQFINSFRPAINTCKDALHDLPGNVDFYLQNNAGNKPEIFFFENKPTQEDGK